MLEAILPLRVGPIDRRARAPTRSDGCGDAFNYTASMRNLADGRNRSLFVEPHDFSRWRHVRIAPSCALGSPIAQLCRSAPARGSGGRRRSSMGCSSSLRRSPRYRDATNAEAAR